MKIVLQILDVFLAIHHVQTAFRLRETYLSFIGNGSLAYLALLGLDEDDTIGSSCTVNCSS